MPRLRRVMPGRMRSRCVAAVPPCGFQYPADAIVSRVTIVVGTSSWSDPASSSIGTRRARRRRSGSTSTRALRRRGAQLHLLRDPVDLDGENWAEGTPEGFRFDVKLHRLLSRHAAQLRELPKDLREDAETNERGRCSCSIPPCCDEMVRRTAEAMRPLADAGKLGSYLLQLTPAFDPRRNELDELAPVIEGLAPPRSRWSSGGAAGPHRSGSRGPRLALGPRRRLRLRRHAAGRPRADLPAD